METKKYNFKKDLIYEFIKDIKDPEKDCTIEELDLIDEDSVSITNDTNCSFSTILIEWKPTTPTCSFAVNIGLCIRYKLAGEIDKFIKILNASNSKLNEKSFKYKIEIKLRKGSHLQEHELNKQLNDKERYCAAVENPLILKYIINLINID